MQVVENMLMKEEGRFVDVKFFEISRLLCVCRADIHLDSNIVCIYA
jgi:hypothetical protein